MALALALARPPLFRLGRGARCGAELFGGQQGPAQPCAAPPPVHSAARFIDGGVSANNPCLVAVAEARGLWGHAADLDVLSVGTGNGIPRTPLKRFPAGAGVVLQNLISATGDVELADTALAAMLRPERDRYLRLSPTGEPFSCELGCSDPATLEALVDHARRYLREPACQERIEAVAERLSRALSARRAQ